MKPEINIEEFLSMSEKLDVRFGIIIQAQYLPKNKKMLTLEVEFLDKQRTVITNIGDRVTPEDLVGRKLPFVLNLPPFETKGITSTAMILVSTTEDGQIDLNSQVGSKLF